MLTYTNAQLLGDGQVDGWMDDLSKKLESGAKTLSELLKIRTDSEIRVKIMLPDGAEIVRRTLPAMALGVVAIFGAYYATRRLLGDNCKR